MKSHALVAGAIIASCALYFVACKTTQHAADQKADVVAVEGIARGVLQAIDARDATRFGDYFSTNGETKSFGHPFSNRSLVGRKAIAEAARRTFENIKEIHAQPNSDLDINVSGDLATFSLTGVNKVVSRDSKRFEAPWRWTAELQRERDGTWRITTDHLSFVEVQSELAALDVSEMNIRGACCSANLQVIVSMPDLKLDMQTAGPVQMYSHVETIPPVGYAATVTLTPTSLLSKGRIVGTLDEARVTFREVVRHEPLDGDGMEQVLWDGARQQFVVAALDPIPSVGAR
jgi:ketosteroid isomerase-like protein